MSNLVPVIVCTELRGVYFGYADPAHLKNDEITIERARACIYWSEKTGGAIGLADAGPGAGSRISARCPSIHIKKITTLMTMTAVAVEAWEAVNVHRG